MKNFSLTRNERVKKKRDFEKVYNAANVLFSSDRLIKVHFICSENNVAVIKIAAAVSKKAGKAVWRNRVKRLIKESYRLNKKSLLEKVLLNAAHVRGSIEGISGMDSVDLNLLESGNEDDMAH